MVYINYGHTPSVLVGKSLCCSQPVKSWNEKSVFVAAFSLVIFQCLLKLVCFVFST